MGKGGGRGRGESKMFRPMASALQYKPSLLGAKNKKTKRILMCEVTVFCVQ